MSYRPSSLARAYAVRALAAILIGSVTGFTIMLLVGLSGVSFQSGVQPLTDVLRIALGGGLLGLFVAAMGIGGAILCIRFFGNSTPEGGVRRMLLTAVGSGGSVVAGGIAIIAWNSISIPNHSPLLTMLIFAVAAVPVAVTGLMLSRSAERAAARSSSA